MNPYIRKISATNLFIVPILGIARDKLLRVGFVEAFIKDELRELQYENAVFLLFRPTKWEEFNLFLEEQRKLKMPIIDEYDLPEGWAIVVYQFPQKWQRDVDILMTGKFSQVSAAYKALIPMYIRTNRNGVITEEMTNQHLIFNKSDRLKEYWKKELDITITNQDEHFSFYPEKEVLNEASLKRLTENL